MAYTQLQIYNNALTNYLGEGALESLSEQRGPRYLLDGVWSEDPIKYCLEQGQWQFATRTVKLEADPSIDPEFGYRFGFPHPDDYCRTVAISNDEYFTEPYTRFADERKIFYAEIDVLYLKFVSDDDTYGRDYANWSPSFFEFISCYHAWKIVNRVTGSKTTRAELQAELEKMKSDAQAKDGSNRPTSFPSRGAWAAARHGRNYFNRERR